MRCGRCNRPQNEHNDPSCKKPVWVGNGVVVAASDAHIPDADHNYCNTVIDKLKFQLRVKNSILSEKNAELMGVRDQHEQVLWLLMGIANAAKGILKYDKESNAPRVQAIEDIIRLRTVAEEAHLRATFAKQLLATALIHHIENGTTPDTQVSAETRQRAEETAEKMIEDCVGRLAPKSVE